MPLDGDACGRGGAVAVTAQGRVGGAPPAGGGGRRPSQYLRHKPRILRKSRRSSASRTSVEARFSGAGRPEPARTNASVSHCWRMTQYRPAAAKGAAASSAAARGAAAADKDAACSPPGGGHGAACRKARADTLRRADPRLVDDGSCSTEEGAPSIARGASPDVVSAAASDDVDSAGGVRATTTAGRCPSSSAGSSSTGVRRAKRLLCCGVRPRRCWRGLATVAAPADGRNDDGAGGAIGEANPAMRPWCSGDTKAAAAAGTAAAAAARGKEKSPPPAATAVAVAATAGSTGGVVASTASKGAAGTVWAAPTAGACDCGRSSGCSSSRGAHRLGAFGPAALISCAFSACSTATCAFKAAISAFAPSSTLGSTLRPTSRRSWRSSC